MKRVKRIKKDSLGTLRPGLTYICYERVFVFSLLADMSLIIYSLGHSLCAFVLLAGHLLLNLCYLCKFFWSTIFYKLGIIFAVQIFHLACLVQITTGIKFGIALNRTVLLSGFGDILLRIRFEHSERLHVSIFLKFFRL